MRTYTVSEVLGHIDKAFAAGYKQSHEAETEHAYDMGYKAGYTQAVLDHAEQEKADLIANICDEQGCTKPVSCGWGPREARRHTCHRHSEWYKESISTCKQCGIRGSAQNPCCSCRSKIDKIEWTPPESKL